MNCLHAFMKLELEPLHILFDTSEESVEKTSYTQLLNRPAISNRVKVLTRGLDNNPLHVVHKPIYRETIAHMPATRPHKGSSAPLSHRRATKAILFQTSTIKN